jgi:NitT/TauT family transport system substrate-binding protein
MRYRATFRRLTSIAMAAAFLAGLLPGSARAELSELKIAIQYGLGYLPLMVAKNHHLIEKQAEAHGAGKVKVTWIVLNGGVAANDALLTGDAQIVGAGIAPLLTIWDKTRGSNQVKALIGLDSSAYWITSNNPKVHSIRDLTEKDRIAVPAVKVSINSVILQIAAEKEFGPGHQYDFERLTVQLSPPEATAALISGRTEITGHITTPIYGTVQLASPNVHRILNSRDAIGRAALVLAYGTSQFYEQNPKLVASFLDAVREGFALIEQDKNEAAHIYLAEEPNKLTEPEVAALLDNPDVSYSLVPVNTGIIADFMYQVGSIKTKPGSWKDYVFPVLHDQPGS